jgi:hypothetical protein
MVEIIGKSKAGEGAVNQSRLQDGVEAIALRECKAPDAAGFVEIAGWPAPRGSKLAS